MVINEQQFAVREVSYTVRCARREDAQALSVLRVQIDSETEMLDRAPGEGVLDEQAFAQIIQTDRDHNCHLFLVAVVDERIVGFSRCEGNDLTRLAHKVTFGVCVLKDFWGYGIGKNLLKQSIAWADQNHIKKMALNVLETNDRAIQLTNN